MEEEIKTNLDDLENKTLIIFDEKGNYFCETRGFTNAAKITNGNPSNIYRAATNGDIISTGGYYFVTKIQARNRTIPLIEKAIKIVIAVNKTRGMADKINAVLKIVNNEKDEKIDSIA